MTARVRLLLLLLAGLVLAIGALRLAWAMPAFGAHPLPYGDAINAAAPLERRVSNAVTAVNFDYRGFDTLGEEFMLLAAVTGTVVLLRGGRGEDLSRRPQRVADRPIPSRTDAVVLVSRWFGPITTTFGVYVTLHATTTPGGGFQGGVIIASGLLLVFFGEAYVGWREVVQSRWLGLIESGGALLFAVMGAAPLALGAPFATNVLPFGTYKDALSGGAMVVDTIGVGLAVAGGFGLIFLEFLEETRCMEPGDHDREER